MKIELLNNQNDKRNFQKGKFWYCKDKSYLGDYIQIAMFGYVLLIWI